jgi:Beta-lactamase enzyme family
MSRRRQLRLLRTVVVFLALVVVSVMLAARGPHRAARAASHPVATGDDLTTSARAVSENPFQQPAVLGYLAAHPGMTATVHDLTTDKVWTYRPGVRQVTASIMKVDILETLLHQSGVLHGDRLTTATGMIENSSNDDAQDLWDDEGGPAAVTSYGEEAGLTGTHANTKGYWGLSTTTASDQVRLLDRLAMPNKLLTRAERDQAMDLMHQVEADQRWGVTAGLPAGTSVAVKNGWLPLDTGKGWQVNSDGIVDGHGYRDDISVLSTATPTEQAGIHEIEGLTRLVWAAMSPTS